jgi:2-polyprenyl-3-methyl-5-hydroxy-6-metoxy-1,4-benzoquinol methylase
MFYGLHTTDYAERRKLLDRDGEEILIPPTAMQKRVGVHKPIIIEEGTEKIYEQPLAEFFWLLEQIKSRTPYDVTDNPYVNLFSYKGNEPIIRVGRLKDLFNSIRSEGIREPVHVEVTGERLDGSFRTKIATFLGIPEVKAILHRFLYTDIDDKFIERKLRARELSSGKPDYYEFSYNDKWNNGKAGPVYRENAERWKDILPLVGDSVVDVGCNEAYISLQLARQGKKVWGIDHDWNHLAYLNKLIFEYIDKKPLEAEFIEGDIETMRPPESDTALLLNVIYHIPYSNQTHVLKKLKSKQWVFQCNLRKEHVRNQYYGSHPDDLEELIERAGKKVVKRIAWKDKPIIIAE